MSNQILEERPSTFEVAVQAPATVKPRWSDVQILLGLTAITLVSHAPLLYLHIRHLLNRSYYEFIYVLPIAIWLMYRRYGGISARPAMRPHVVKSVVGILVAACLYALAIFLWSPWLAAVSAVATFIALVYSAWGSPRLRALMPAVLLACLIIPPPLRYDAAITGSLRSLATVCSSRVLDSLGVLHLAEGNIITVASGSLFVADACSGVNSLYSLLAVGLFYCLWSRRHWFHTVLLLALVVPIVVLENTFRIALIPLSLDWFNVDLSSGWKHTVLGIVLFVLSALLLSSFDQLLKFFAPIGNAFRALIAWFTTKPRRSGYMEYGAAPSASRPSDSRARGNSLLPAGRIGFAKVIVTAALFFIGGGILQSVLFAKSLAARPDVPDFDLSKIGRDALPPEWNGWKQVAFDEITRAKDDPFGEHSLAWTYRRGEQTASFSVDFTFPRIHDLSKCYTAIGWSLRDRQVGEDAHKSPYMEIEMQRKNYGDARLFFSLHSKQGHTEAHAFGERLIDHFNKRFGYRLEEAGPWFQLQLFASVDNLNDAQQSQEAAQMFAAMRQQVLHSIGQTSSAH